MSMRWVVWLSLGVIGASVTFYLLLPSPTLSSVPTVMAVRRDLHVEVKTIGELEAARSTVIASSIKGDQGKIIDLIPDGLYVEPGQLLVRLDPTPFEEKIEKLHAQIKEQEAYIASLRQTLEWEKTEADHKNRMSFFEVESAQLELDKVIHGDGPQEILRLKAAMQKARLKYDELKAYSQDLAALEAEGWLNTAEVKQAQKKLTEEEESYEMAAQQYESYVSRVHPMQVKKAETHLKRTQVAQEETVKSGFYTVAKSLALLNQAEEMLHDYFLQLREAESECKATEMRAPASGMVVHREDYRAGQRRKPRIGDILVKNQPLLDLPDLDSLFIKTRVREGELFKVTVGKRATIEVDAYPQLAFEGRVSLIGVLAFSDGMRTGEEKYFEVHIALDKGDLRLRPGMTTRIVIHAEEVLNALTIPLHAVFDEGKEAYCYVEEEAHGYKKRGIALGLSNAQWVEIKAGIREGESICLLNPFDGM